LNPSLQWIENHDSATVGVDADGLHARLAKFGWGTTVGR
jgi:hypothetical protein